jgi:hypothetical protein
MKGGPSSMLVAGFGRHAKAARGIPARCEMFTPVESVIRTQPPIGWCVPP